MAHPECRPYLMLLPHAVRLLLVGAIIALVPLCYASPVDQSWIGGFYDDDDHDDVVILVTDSVGLSSDDCGVAVHALPCVELGGPGWKPQVAERSLLVADGRGPPSSEDRALPVTAQLSVRASAARFSLAWRSLVTPQVDIS